MRALSPRAVPSLPPSPSLSSLHILIINEYSAAASASAAVRDCERSGVMLNYGRAPKPTGKRVSSPVPSLARRVAALPDSELVKVSSIRRSYAGRPRRLIAERAAGRAGKTDGFTWMCLCLPLVPSSPSVCSSLPTAKHRNDGLRGDNEGLEEEEEEEGRPRPATVAPWLKGRTRASERLTLANTFLSSASKRRSPAHLAPEP